MRLPSKIVLRLLAGFFAVIFVAAVFLVLQTRSIVRKELLDRAIAYHQQTVHVESYYLSSQMQQAALRTIVLSHRKELLEFFSSGDSEDKTRLAERRLQSFLDQDPQFVSASLIGPDFQTALSIVRETSLSGPDQELSSQIHEDSVDPLNSMAKVPLSIEAISLPGTNVRSTLRFTTPILDENEIICGLLSLDLPLATLLANLAPHSDHGRFFVIDDQGELLFSGDNGTNGTKLPLVSDVLKPHQLQNLSRSREGHTIEPNGLEYLVIHSRLDPHLATGINATLVQLIPLDTVFSPLYLVIGTISLSVIAVFGLTLCILAILVYRLIQPIGRLSNEMISYNPGDRPEIEERDLSREDEIGRLFKSFQFMAKALNESFDKVRHQMSALEETNQKLRHKTRESEELAKAKSDFLAVMSHEIRTPINAIVGFSQLLDDDSPPEERAHCVQRIIENSERLLFLIENILDFTRIQGGRVQIAEEEFNMAIELDSICDNFRTRLTQNNISLVLQMGPEVDTILCGDPDRIRQIISNLVENALKFTLSGEIRIQARLFPNGPEQYHLEVSVEDTGVGIPKEKIDSIFQPFEQADHGLKRRFEGSGLGLAISKRLADLMNGNLSVESTVGKGSRFTLSLFPRICKSKLTLSETPTNRLGSHQAQPNLPAHFLIIEDDPNNAEVLQKFLIRAGARSVKIANNKESASHCLQKNRSDVILMDIHLGEESGIDLINEIRAGKYSPVTPPNAPVAAITAYALGEVREQCEMAKVDAFVTKPFSSSNLSQTLKDLLSARSSNS
tara:strand:+ start:19773 stop:22142 length:2370 start_codon:yes stop_codon:yes gene_type:complete